MPTDEELWEALEKPKVEFSMYATRGTNLIAVGWRDGVLRCAFTSKDGPRYYSYAGVPEAEFVKLKNSPFPDKLFASNIRGKFQVQAA